MEQLPEGRRPFQALDRVGADEFSSNRRGSLGSLTRKNSNLFQGGGGGHGGGTVREHPNEGGKISGKMSRSNSHAHFRGHVGGVGRPRRGSAERDKRPGHDDMGDSEDSSATHPSRKRRMSNSQMMIQSWASDGPPSKAVATRAIQGSRSTTGGSRRSYTLADWEKEEEMKMVEEQVREVTQPVKPGDSEPSSIALSLKQSMANVLTKTQQKRRSSSPRASSKVHEAVKPIEDDDLIVAPTPMKPAPHQPINPPLRRVTPEGSLSASEKQLPDRKNTPKVLPADVKHDLIVNKVLVKAKNRFVLKPHGGTRLTWDTAILAMLFYVSSVIPLHIAFGLDSEGNYLLLEYFIDACFLVDILLNFRTGFMLENGRECMNPPEIATHYMRTWFVVDFIASVPWKLFLWRGNIQMLKMGTVVKSVRILKLGKLIRFLKLPIFMQKVEEIWGTTRTSMAFLRLIISTFSISHLTACCWIYLALDSYKEEEVTWLTSYNMHGGKNGYQQYTAAIYLVITTLTTVGYGDIVPVTDSERLFAAGSMLFSGAFYGYFIASMATLISNRDRNKMAYNEKMDVVATYLKIRKFPKELARRVKKYYHYYYQTRTAVDESFILSELSVFLRREVAMHLIHKIIYDVPFFANRDPATLARLLPILCPLMCIPDEYVIYSGDNGTEMYIIISGEMLVEIEREVDPDSSESPYLVVASLICGDYFGELAAFGISSKRTASIKAATVSELYSISKEDLVRAYEDYGEVLNDMREIAAQKYVPLDTVQKGMTSYLTLKKRIQRNPHQLHKVLSTKSMSDVMDLDEFNDDEKSRAELRASDSFMLAPTDEDDYDLVELGRLMESVVEKQTTLEQRLKEEMKSNRENLMKAVTEEFKALHNSLAYDVFNGLSGNHPPTWDGGGSPNSSTFSGDRRASSSALIDDMQMKPLDPIFKKSTL